MKTAKITCCLTKLLNSKILSRKSQNPRCWLCSVRHKWWAVTYDLLQIWQAGRLICSLSSTGVWSIQDSWSGPDRTPPPPTLGIGCKLSGGIQGRLCLRLHTQLSPPAELPSASTAQWKCASPAYVGLLSLLKDWTRVNKVTLPAVEEGRR